MNPDEKEVLQKTFELAEENNKILKGIRSSNRWSLIFKIFYWVIIIGIAVGAFYYIQPYVDMATKAYKSVQGDFQNAKNVVNTASNALKSVPK